MRTEEQMLRRINKDRSNLQRGTANYHYDNMKAAIDRLYVSPQELHFDDGRAELNSEPVFGWRDRIYGYQAMKAPA
jgi:hypothetical protein